jgi:hypothetical protein
MSNAFTWHEGQGAPAYAQRSLTGESVIEEALIRPVGHLLPSRFAVATQHGRRR